MTSKQKNKQAKTDKQANKQTNKQKTAKSKKLTESRQKKLERCSAWPGAGKTHYHKGVVKKIK